MLDGSTLRRIRLLNNKTQKGVAEACGCTIRYIQYVESNEMNPSEELYNDFLNYCYKGIKGEKAKAKREEENIGLEEEREQAPRKRVKR